ncbi:MAG TPA: FkbM family methyltransferase [Bordetella sp.]|uniref:FkbM family methyltransferase n=1 Tax=Bordetella sp. TaxID=28081 RepID=UPI002ED697F2
MPFPERPIAFVLTAANHGTMIVNRNDHSVDASGGAIGVGFQILDKSSYDATEVAFALALLDRRRKYFGDGVVAIDGGANIGVHTIEWARHMHGWGAVLSFEAQEIIFYALAGNIALNNCLNARAKLAALGERDGELNIPEPNYFAHASFGSLELRQRENTEDIGQRISYDPSQGTSVPMIRIDSIGLVRVDFLKLDVEGMEAEALRGARNTLQTHKPILLIEIIKSDQAAIKAMLDELGYRHFPFWGNLVAVHADDPVLRHMSYKDDAIYFT